MMIGKLLRELYHPTWGGEWPDARRWANSMVSPLVFVIVVYGGPVILLWGKLPWFMRVWGGLFSLMALYLLWVKRNARLYLMERGEL